MGHKKQLLDKQITLLEDGEIQRTWEEAVRAHDQADRIRERAIGPYPDTPADNEYRILDVSILPLLVALTLQRALLDYAILRYLDAEQSDGSLDNYLVDYVAIVNGVPEKPLTYHGIDLTEKTHLTFVVDGRSFSVPIRVDIYDGLSYVFIVKNGDPGQMFAGRFQFNPNLRNLLSDQTFDSTIRPEEYEHRLMDFRRKYHDMLRHSFSSVFFNYQDFGVRYHAPDVSGHLWTPKEYTPGFLLDFLVTNCRKEKPQQRERTVVLDWNALENVRVSAQVPLEK
jgi:hypothetical protein